MALVDLFIEKMEERNELTAKLWTGKTASQSEVKVDNTWPISEFQCQPIRSW